eukprot:scaffold2916_cov190-Skeletonema_menzelii.AAC.3
MPKKSTDNLHSLLEDGVRVKNDSSENGEANHILADDLYQLAQQKVLHALDSLYEEYTFASAKDASLTDDLRRRISSSDGTCEHDHTEDSLVYGEIDLRGFCDLLMHHVPHSSDDVFYDLGSGSGRAVFAARFVGDFRECVGIELLSNLHEMATSVRNLLDHDGWWKDGTVVYVPNLLFDDSLKAQIAEKAVRMRAGACLICLKKFEGAAFNAVFEFVKERPVVMSWECQKVNWKYHKQCTCFAKMNSFDE